MGGSVGGGQTAVAWAVGCGQRDGHVETSKRLTVPTQVAEKGKFFGTCQGIPFCRELWVYE